MSGLNLGARIRAWRVQHGWSQTELAEEIGVSKSYLSHIEKGRRPVGPKALARIAQALGLDVEALDGPPTRVAVIHRTLVVSLGYEDSPTMAGEMWRVAEQVAQAVRWHDAAFERAKIAADAARAREQRRRRTE